MKFLSKKITILIMALVMAVTAAFAVACDGEPNDKDKGEITYTVTVENNVGEPFADISVVVLGTSHVGNTDGEGKWSFTAPKKTYNLMFGVPEGYEKTGYSVTAKNPNKKFTLVKRGNEVGDICFDFELNGYNGVDKVKLSDICGEGVENAKTVVVNFWGTWCEPCKNELPEFEKVGSERDDVEIIAVHSVYGLSYDENNVPSVQAFLDEKGWNTWGIIFAQDTGTVAVSETYALLGGTGSYPTTLVIDKNGIIRSVFTAMISEQTLVAAIEAAAA